MKYLIIRIILLIMTFNFFVGCDTVIDLRFINDSYGLTNSDNIPPSNVMKKDVPLIYNNVKYLGKYGEGSGKLKKYPNLPSYYIKPVLGSTNIYFPTQPNFTADGFLQ